MFLLLYLDVICKVMFILFSHTTDGYPFRWQPLSPPSTGIQPYGRMILPCYCFEPGISCLILLLDLSQKNVHIHPFEKNPLATGASVDSAATWASTRRGADGKRAGLLAGGCRGMVQNWGTHDPRNTWKLLTFHDFQVVMAENANWKMWIQSKDLGCASRK